METGQLLSDLQLIQRLTRFLLMVVVVWMAQSQVVKDKMLKSIISMEI